jgi:hypothetical protein
MHNGNLFSRKLDVVTACRPVDGPILKLALDGLRRLIPFQHLHVITARENFGKFEKLLGPVNLIDQDTLIPGMKLADLKKFSLPGFPRGAGWYFQQFLKLAFSFQNQDDDYYLIWDADTVPLRPFTFFDESGRMTFTTAEEEHAPYFDNYRNLLGEEPNREFSFIAQHMIVQKSVAREMLSRIETRFPGDESWAWKIVRNLEGSGTNLFSEYEILGHFVKNHYPERTTYRSLSWLREGSIKIGGVPRAEDLRELARNYDFVAFESGQRPLRRFVRKLRGLFTGP